VNGIKKRGKAEVGDKTMLDALVPAVDAFEKGLKDGSDIKTVLDDTVKAARAGAESTANMKAKFSRAGYRPDGAIGVQDAGATAVYYLIASFAKAVTACL
jgi:phosphoenolpyruvate---glycerone phosphotransferase subunit DhaL